MNHALVLNSLSSSYLLESNQGAASQAASSAQANKKQRKTDRKKIHKVGGGNRSNRNSPEVARMIEAARAGDESAFRQLIGQYWQCAQRAARRILQTEEAAADAVQDALVKAYNALPRFENGNFRSWLLRIVTNTCYDHLRRERRNEALSLEMLAEERQRGPAIQDLDIEVDPEAVAMQQERTQVLRQAIERLPLKLREAIIVIDVQGYDYVEAAKLLDIPLGTLKSRLCRARVALRDQLVVAGVMPASSKSESTKMEVSDE